MQCSASTSQRLASGHLRAACGAHDDESFPLPSWVAFVALPIVVFPSCSLSVLLTFALLAVPGLSGLSPGLPPVATQLLIVFSYEKWFVSAFMMESVGWIPVFGSGWWGIEWLGVGATRARDMPSFRGLTECCSRLLLGHWLARLGLGTFFCLRVRLL